MLRFNIGPWRLRSHHGRHHDAQKAGRQKQECEAIENVLRIDWASDHHDVAVVDDTGTCVRGFGEPGEEPFERT